MKTKFTLVRQVAGFTAVAVMLFLSFFSAFPSYAVNPVSECYGSTAITNTGNTVVSCTLAVTAGQTLTVGVVWGSNTAQTFSSNTPTDTVGSGFNTLVPIFSDYQFFSAVVVYNGTVQATSASDTVQSSCGITAGGGGTGLCSMWVYEAPKTPGHANSYLTARGSCRDSNSQNCILQTNSSLSIPGGYFAMAFGQVQLSPQPTCVTTSGFTMDAHSNQAASGTFFVNCAEFAGTWAGGSTQATMVTGAHCCQTITIALVALFGPGNFHLTTTLTVTGMVAPNLTGDGNWQWLIGLFFLLFPVAILDSMVVTPIGAGIRDGIDSHVEGDTVIFTTLLGLFIGSIIGVMPTINALPLATPFMFGVLFVVYWYVGRK